ncbi:MAG: RNA polymerase sigma factor [Verrucomicrobiota bacterium]
MKQHATTSSEVRPGWFATTLWTQVKAATDPEKTRGWDALQILCERYWYPLYAFARQLGNDRESARDLVQGFFERLLSRQYLAQADPMRGRFRSFLLGAFKHYIQNQWNKQRALKRGGGTELVSLDALSGEERLAAETWQTSDPERAYERRWALSLLGEVMDVLRAQWESVGRLDEFERLKPHMLKQAGQIRYQDIAKELRLSEAAVKMKVKRLREQYRDLLHRKVADTIDDPTKIQEELGYLQYCLSSS